MTGGRKGSSRTRREMERAQLPVSFRLSVKFHSFCSLTRGYFSPIGQICILPMQSWQNHWNFHLFCFTVADPTAKLGRPAGQKFHRPERNGKETTDNPILCRRSSQGSLAYQQEQETLPGVTIPSTRVVAPSGGSPSSINVSFLNGPVDSSSQPDLVKRITSAAASEQPAEQDGLRTTRPGQRFQRPS